MRTVSRSALIVDGLALSLTAEDLAELFKPFGTILLTQVALDPFRRSLGFGYVIMETEDGASQAIQALDGHTVAGRALHIVRTQVPPLPKSAQFDQAFNARPQSIS